MLIKNYKTLLLNLFVITLVGGSFMLEFRLFGITLYAFRVLLLLSLPILLFKGELKFYTNKVSKYTFFFLIIWLLYAGLSLLWCIDKTAAYKDIMYLLFGLATFVFFVSIKKGYEQFEEELASIWTVVFIVVVIVSVWEIYTANHLVSSLTARLYELKPFHKLNYVPVFTFDNSNHFAIYCSLSVVFFAGTILKKQKLVLSGFLIACCMFIIHLSQARFGIITLFVFAAIVLFYFYFKREKNELKQLLLKAGKFLLVALFLISSIFCFHAYENVQNKIMTPADLITSDNHLPSNVLRKNLLLNGMDFFKQSKGLGVGAGNYKSYINKGGTLYETDGIDSPHNWPMEILSQYGIGITFLFVVLFGYILFVIYSSVKKTGFSQKHLQLLLLLVCYTIMSNANSIFLPLPINWLMLSLIVIYTDDLLPDLKT